MQTKGNCKKWMNTGGDLHTIIYFLLLQDNAWINCITNKEYLKVKQIGFLTMLKILMVAPRADIEDYCGNVTCDQVVKR